MRNTKIALLLFFLPFATNAQSGKFTIQGNLPAGADAFQFVYLRYGAGKEFALDSFETTNNSFSFTGHINDTDVHAAYLSFGNTLANSMRNEQATLYIRNGDEITVTSKQTFADDVEGSEQTTFFRHLQKDLKGSSPSQAVSIYRQLIEKYPDSKMSFDLFIKRFNNGAIDNRYTAQLPEIIDAFSKFSSRLKESETGKIYIGEVKRRISLSPGGTLPGLESTTAAGKKMKLSDLRGKYVLVDFWASWCLPCRKQFPTLKKAYTHYKNRNFEIVAYSIDHVRADWVGAIKTENASWINVSDLKGPADPIAEAFGITGVPANFLISPDGKVLATNLVGDEVEETLQKFLK